MHLDVAEDDKLPAVHLISAVLSEVWLCRKEKRPCHLNTINASFEAGIHILRKRHQEHKGAADNLSHD
jgi:hypothetical protein